MFKTLKPLFREDRERLWTAFSMACEEMKQAQAENTNGGSMIRGKSAIW